MALPPISPSGVSTAFIYPRQTTSTGTGLPQVLSAAPAFTNPPIIFEPPFPLTNGDLLVWIIASGASVNWGGCTVYVSVDNTTYAPIGTIIAGTTQDADDFLTLCYCDGELIAYSATTLTTAYNYNLGTYIRRGVDNTTIGSHAAGTQFGRILATTFSQQYPSNFVGKTLYFKFPAFNTYGGAVQALADVPYYTYTLTGIGAKNANSWFQSFSVGGKFSDMVLDEWDNNYEIFDVQAPVALTFPAN